MPNRSRSLLTIPVLLATFAFAAPRALLAQGGPAPDVPAPPAGAAMQTEPMTHAWSLAFSS